MTDPRNEPRVIRLLIADDEHLIRGALSALLNLEPDIEVPYPRALQTALKLIQAKL